MCFQVLNLEFIRGFFCIRILEACYTVVDVECVSLQFSAAIAFHLMLSQALQPLF